MEQAGVPPITREFLPAFAEHARQQGSAIRNLKYGPIIEDYQTETIEFDLHDAHYLVPLRERAHYEHVFFYPGGEDLDKRCAHAALLAAGYDACRVDIRTTFLEVKEPKQV